jgi:hypothetical protein
MAHTAELSNRPSSHCNVFDALHAVEMLMGQPAAQQMTFVPPAAEDDAAEGVLATAAIAGGGALHVAPTSANIKPHSTAAQECEAANEDDAVDPESAEAERLVKSLSAQNGWESIAEFAFGPNWLEHGIQLIAEQTHDPALANEIAPQGIHGPTESTKNTATVAIVNNKVVDDTTQKENGMNGSKDNWNSAKAVSTNDLEKPSTLGNGGGQERDGGEKNEENNKRAQILAEGWNAPYPDVVPTYPRRKKIRMNFATVALMDEACFEDQRPLLGITSKSVSKKGLADKKLSAADKKVAAAADRKARRETLKKEKSEAAEAKRSAEANDDIRPSATGESSNEEDNFLAGELRPHRFGGPIPPWLPPFPPTYTYQTLKQGSSSSRKVAAAATAACNSAKSAAPGGAVGNEHVRQSLVNIQRKDQEDNPFHHWGATTSTVGEIAVRSGVGDIQNPPSASSVAPLVRPSVNRANRILEGSMDSNPV